MNQNHLSLAKAYYQALAAKDLAASGKYLHPNVQCSGPLVNVNGKESVLRANEKFITLFTTLKIRSSFASENQVMIVYDLELVTSINIFSAAALLTLQDSLIDKIELFYDASPFHARNG